MSIGHGWVSHLGRFECSLGSYDILIGMDWSKAHRENIDCYSKTFECLDEEGNLRVVKGFPKSDLRKAVFNSTTE